jgi:hypothetical protein
MILEFMSMLMIVGVATGVERLFPKRETRDDETAIVL